MPAYQAPLANQSLPHIREDAVNASEPAQVVVCCTECRHLFQPSLEAALRSSGCERCGGWTWIAQSGPIDLPEQRQAPGNAQRQREHQATGDQRGNSNA